jgi:hypothetical protein
MMTEITGCIRRGIVMPHLMLPNFLIIGAGRSGTTSLYHYLRQHPQVFMSDVKEPNYFAFGRGPHRAVGARWGGDDRAIPDGPGAAWLRATSVTTREAYEALFERAGTAKAVGEASTRYLIHEHVPVTIHAALPDVRLIAMLRHPVDRAFANYLAYRRDGYDPAPTFEAAIADQDRRRRDGWPFGPFVDFGFYTPQLTRYFDVFPRDRMRVYLYDDLVADATALVRDVFEFLEVDTSFVPRTSDRYGETGMIRNPLLRVVWAHTQRPRMAVGPLLPAAWRDRANAWATRGLVRPAMRPDTRAQLLATYRGDTLALQDLLGRDLTAWLK